MNATSTRIDYDALAAQIASDRGATVALDGTQPDDGYAVSLEGSTQRLRTLTRRAVADALYAFVTNHAATLREPGHYLGAWLYGDILYLDVSQVVDTWDEAFTLGVTNGQRAVYNLATHRVIELADHRQAA